MSFWLSSWFWIILLSLVVILLWKLYRNECEKSSELRSSKTSLAVKHGSAIEQFAPFMDSYPFATSGFRSLGSPVDGIQFNPDGIFVIEFKTGNSKLNENQKRIKKLIEEKKVYFKEVRIK